VYATIEWVQQAYSLLSVVIVVLSPQLRKCSLHTAIATEICKKSEGDKQETVRSHKQNKHQQLPIIDEPPKSFNPFDHCTQTLPSYGYGNYKFKMAMNNDFCFGYFQQRRRQ